VDTSVCAVSKENATITVVSILRRTFNEGAQSVQSSPSLTGANQVFESRHTNNWV